MESISERSTSLGPWGGPGGNEWSCKFGSRLSGIAIVHGDAIFSLAFKGDATAGQYFLKVGGEANGARTDQVNINWPNEYLVSISGTFESWYTNGTATIRSLCFYTNLKKYGPFGKESGSAFTIPIKCGVVVGFHGRAATCLDAIGVDVVPNGLIPPPSQIFTENELVSSEKCISLGPWGGPGGSEWSCKFDYGIISGIVIRHGDCIDSVAFRSGNACKKFGGNGGHLTGEVNINWPKEYLIGISGTFERWYTAGTPTIRSLCFYTNLKKYGPFGKESGPAFTIPIKCGVVVGFHGRAGVFLDAIGLYVIPSYQ